MMLDGLSVLSGTVFHDQDHDGLRDVGESGLADWTVQLQHVNSRNVPDRAFSNPTPDEWSQFGRFVAFVGEDVLVGSHYDDVAGMGQAGAAYLIDGTTGDLRHTFISPNPSDNDKFGRAVAAVGNNVLIGAPTDDVAANNAGAAYLFDSVTGQLLHTFLNPDPAVNDQFGRAVAAVGNHVLVGARLADVAWNDSLVEDAGAAYLFDADTGELRQTFISPSPTENAQFGYSVAAMGDDVLVGARYDETGADGVGAAYLFDGETGNILQTYVNPTQRASGEPSDFGRSVAAAGDNVLVGARWDDTGAREAGSAFLFDGASGELLRTFTSPTPSGGEEYGFTVAAIGNDVLVGARWDNRQDGEGEGNGGAVYMYDGATGQLLQTFANPAPGAWDSFGVSVAARDDQILVGTQAGNTVYRFEAANSSPVAVTKADGTYRFAELASGTYRIRPEAPEGYVQTPPGVAGTMTVELEDDGQRPGLDFGFVRNQSPVAVDDHYSMSEDGVLTRVASEGLLGNDTDADGNNLAVSMVNQPPYGTIALLSDGSFRYRPDADFSGSDSFTYRSHDGLGYSNLATVTITVEPVNDAPIAHDDGLWVAMNAPRVVNAPGVMTDDVDADGDRLTASIVDPPSHGTATLAPNGGLAYVPEIDYVGRDQFTYRIDDGTLESNTATVYVNVSDRIFDTLLRVTEINYDPYPITADEREMGIEDREAFEFIELQNTGDRRLDLAGLQITEGVQFELFDTTWIEPGERALIVKDRGAFEARYGTGLRILGEYDGDLRNSGDRVTVRDPFDQVIVDLKYRHEGTWTAWAHGYGSTLEVVDTRGDYNDGLNWRPSRQYGGSPGVEGSGSLGIVINEVLTHANLPATDAIELHNLTDAEVDISGWYLSDSANDFRGFRIPDETVIPAGGYRTFDEHDFNPGRWDRTARGFALESARGEDVWLTAADAGGNLTRFVDHVQFGAALNGESFGRWPNATGELYPMDSLTLGHENSGPRIGPIIISEVMYDPPAPANGMNPDDLEFIEIFNPTDEPWDTPNWHLRGGVDFEFPTRYGNPVPKDIPGRITVGPGETLVLVGFDPRRERETLGEFRQHYSIDESVRIAGPYQGTIDDSGDTVRVTRPDYPPQWEPHHFPNVVEDEVVFDDTASWPATADGQGDSLHRQRLDSWGNDPNSWRASPPTPGTVDMEFGGLAISEVNYDPYAATEDELAVNATWNNDAFEFIELSNFGEQTIDLGGVRFTSGVEFDFPPATTLAAGENIVIVRDLRAFQLRYGTDTNVVGQYDGGLRNDGERITLVSDSHGRILDFEYSVGGAWPARAVGGGSSLELQNPFGNYSNGTNWRPSTEYGGSPGRVGVGPIGDIVINELLTRTDGQSLDAIELYNPSSHDVDVSGWFLSDSSRNLEKYSIPVGTTIPSHGYMVIDERDFNPRGGDPPAGGFGLSGEGEDVWLTAASPDGSQMHIIDHVQFGAARIGESFGRWPDSTGPLYPMSHLTLGGENSGPRVGPVIISELMYHPRNPGVVVDPSGLEFVEVYNPGDEPIDLTNWMITDAIEFQFVTGTRILPRAALIVTPFDPNDTNMLTTFRRHYRLDESVTVVGPYSGQLSNAGERVQLLRAEIPRPNRPDEVLRTLEDEVAYSDEAPWATEADGYGHSLHRRAPTLWGNRADSWISAWPTPGWGELAAGDANRSGQFDQLDLVQVLQNGKYLTGGPAGWEEGDWNGDRVFDQRDIVAALQTGGYLKPSFAAWRLDLDALLSKPGAMMQFDADVIDDVFGELDG